MVRMAKKQQKKAAGEGSRSRGPVLFVRLDDATEEALRAFIGAQTVGPDRTAVALKALHEFLAKHGFWPLSRPSA